MNWWWQNWHWMPWNWVPRYGYLVCFDGEPGYVVFDRWTAEQERETADDADKHLYTVKRIWISPHALEMAGEFQGW
jgi:hypothetical protein